MGQPALPGSQKRPVLIDAIQTVLREGQMQPMSAGLLFRWQRGQGVQWEVLWSAGQVRRLTTQHTTAYRTAKRRERAGQVNA